MSQISSSETWSVSREDAKKVHEAFPPRVRRGFNRLQSLIKKAIVMVSESGEDIEYLIGKIVSYYASEEGRGKYARIACTWLNDEGWTEHEDLWNPDRAREKAHRDIMGKLFYKPQEDDIQKQEDGRVEFIQQQTQEQLDEACSKIIDDPSNGYKDCDKIINSTRGRMLLAKQLEK